MIISSYSLDSNPDNKIVLLETARTVAALEQYSNGFVLASRLKAEELMKAEKLEEAATLVLELDEMVPGDKDVLLCKINLLVKSGNIEAAKSLCGENISKTEFDGIFKK